jgi:hypothetical protein
MTNRLTMGETMADSKTLPKNAAALPKKIIVIGCERLKTTESKVSWQKRN